MLWFDWNSETLGTNLKNNARNIWHTIIAEYISRPPFPQLHAQKSRLFNRKAAAFAKTSQPCSYFLTLSFQIPRVCLYFFWVFITQRLSFIISSEQSESILRRHRVFEAAGSISSIVYSLAEFKIFESWQFQNTSWGHFSSYLFICFVCICDNHAKAAIEEYIRI